MALQDHVRASSSSTSTSRHQWYLFAGCLVVRVHGCEAGSTQSWLWSPKSTCRARRRCPRSLSFCLRASRIALWLCVCHDDGRCRYTCTPLYFKSKDPTALPPLLDRASPDSSSKTIVKSCQCSDPTWLWSISFGTHRFKSYIGLSWHRTLGTSSSVLRVWSHSASSLFLRECLGRELNEFQLAFKRAWMTRGRNCRFLKSDQVSPF